MKQWKQEFARYILERGKLYVAEGRVMDLDYHPSGDFTAEVEGTYPYYVTGRFDKGEAYDLTCTCPYADEGNLCKHMAAVLFKLTAELRRAQASGRGFSIGGGTSESASRILDYYAPHHKEDQIPVIKAYISRSFWDNETPMLYFRVGVKGHMYKLQDFNSLVNLIDRVEPVHLGKFFDQVIIPEELDHSSKIWLRFLKRIDQINSLSPNYYYSETKNQLPVTGGIADEIDHAIQAGALVYLNEIQYPLERKVEKLSPKLIVTKEGEPNDPQRSLKVSFHLPDNFVQGNDAYYEMDFNRWNVYGDAKIVELGKLFAPEKKVSFGVDTMSTFFHQVLPRLAEQVKVKIEGKQENEDFIPQAERPLYLFDYQDGIIFCRLGIKVGDEEKFLEAHAGNEYLSSQIHNEIRRYFAEYDPQLQAYLLDVEEADELLNSGLDELKKSGIVKGTAAFKQLVQQPTTHFSVGVSTRSHLLDLKFGADDLSFAEIKQLLEDDYAPQTYHRIGKRLLKVNSDEVKELRTLIKGLGMQIDQLGTANISVPLYRAFYLDALLTQQQMIDYKTSDQYRQLINQVHEKAVPEKEPEGLQAELRPYQKEAFHWLTMMARYNFGGLLADEMGLGKTLQMISLILSNHQDGQSVVIAPAAVIYNWRDECAKFAPQLKVQVLDGSKSARRAQFEEARDRDVIISSYDSFKRDLDFYQDQSFNNEIIDEAQYIKNPQTAAAKAIKAVQADHRFALTGTPIENRLSELWSIFDYLMPGFLGNYRQFKKKYENPIVKHQDQQAEKELKELVQPFILRRLKKDVLQELPDKNENIVYAPLIGKQAQLYQARVAQLSKRLESQDDEEFRQERFKVLAEITRLRQLCCSPALLNDQYRGRSGKVEQVKELVSEEIAAGHKILLFSQFTTALAILEKQFTKMGIKCFLIEGKTKKNERLDLVKEFNEYPEPAIFLISLKAGGTGLNLTSADVVIHFDPWWNVAAENQATDRAHRIGQKHNVEIYKLIAKDTIEERIVEMQAEKNNLANAILSGEKIGSTNLDRGTLLKLLK